MEGMNAKFVHVTAGASANPDLALVARLIGDDTRATFCLALLDGRAWTATELARHAGGAASTATEHLNALVAGNLFAEERQGRHRYVRLANQQVAELIENLAAIAQAMTERGLLDWGRGLRLTGAGAAWLADLGIEVQANSRRPAVRACLDWTERRPHLAGVVGAAMCHHAFEHGWISRVGSTHAVTITDAGRKVLSSGLGLPEEILTRPHS